MMKKLIKTVVMAMGAIAIMTLTFARADDPFVDIFKNPPSQKPDEPSTSKQVKEKETGKKKKKADKKKKKKKKKSKKKSKLKRNKESQ